MVNRIRVLRKAAGLSLQALGDRAGTSPQQIGRLEKSQRRLSDVWLDRLAKALDCRPQDLIAEPPPLARVVGFVGAGEEVFPEGDHDAAEPIASPPGLAHPHAVIVKGDSMLPVYRDGDTLFYEPRQLTPGQALGRDCIVQVHDGPCYVKRVGRGSAPGLFDLASYNRPDVLPDRRLDWAADIRWILRAG